MGPDLIIEVDVLVHTFAEVCCRGIIPAVGFLFFKCGKESLCHCIVIGPPRVGKGLPDTTGAEQRHKGVRYVLPAPVTVKDQVAGASPALKRTFESRRHKVGAALS